MARAHAHRGKLIGCPTCGTKVDEVDIGLRDFSWVNEVLPGKLGLMDIDGTLTQFRTGRVLMMELKPAGDSLSEGARLTFALFVRAGFDVWLVWDHGNGWVEAAELDDDGEPYGVRMIRRSTLANKVREWWDEGLT